LEVLVDEAKTSGWSGDFDNAWSDWDINLIGDRWHDITIRTATEELGWPRRFTRARCSVSPTFFAYTVAFGSSTWAAAAILKMQLWPLAVAFLLTTFCAFRLVTSRRKCLRAATELVARAGKSAGLSVVTTSTKSEEDDQLIDTLEDNRAPTAKREAPATAAVIE
jgi:hypothetical protein